MRRSKMIRVVVALLTGICIAGGAGIDSARAADQDAPKLTAEQKQKRQNDILALRNRTLADLYKLKPETTR